MHRPTTEARPSIYYDYTVHEPWLPSAHAAQTRKKLVIVGSGPAGMVAALELARHGVPSVRRHRGAARSRRAAARSCSRGVRWRSCSRSAPPTA